MNIKKQEGNFFYFIGLLLLICICFGCGTVGTYFEKNPIKFYVSGGKQQSTSTVGQTIEIK